MGGICLPFFMIVIRIEALPSFFVRFALLILLLFYFIVT